RRSGSDCAAAGCRAQCWIDRVTPFDDIKDFAAALTRHHAVVGLDLGTKTIGVAVSDRQLSVASPLETI
ncbi:MAG TPA: hypothetical protein DD416_05855, partial [Rhodobacteraceae bacterium]|nr:hypothetical protein [Paracoccaceae bacterium]